MGGNGFRNCFGLLASRMKSKYHKSESEYFFAVKVKLFFSWLKLLDADPHGY